MDGLIVAQRGRNCWLMFLLNILPDRKQEVKGLSLIFGIITL